MESGVGRPSRSEHISIQVVRIRTARRHRSDDLPVPGNTRFECRDLTPTIHGGL